MNIAPKSTLTVLAFISFAIVQVSHSASYYKWVDEQGTTHYTQAAPPQNKVNKVEINPQISSDSATAIKNLDTQNKKNLKDQGVAAAIAAKAGLYALADTERRKKNAPQCQKYHDALAQLQSGQRLRTEAVNGDRSVLTEAQKENKIQQNMNQIQQNCL